MIEWLKYLMDTYLVPGAPAPGTAGFEEFTGDHVLNGMVVGSRRDNRELYSITVRDNDVAVEMLWPGVPDWSDYEPLAYQSAIDRWRKWECEWRLRKAGEPARQARAEVMAEQSRDDR
jgi:hypothetical protein